MKSKTFNLENLMTKMSKVGLQSKLRQGEKMVENAKRIQPTRTAKTRPKQQTSMIDAVVARTRSTQPKSKTHRISKPTKKQIMQVKSILANKNGKMFTMDNKNKETLDMALKETQKRMTLLRKQAMKRSMLAKNRQNIYQPRTFKPRVRIMPMDEAK